MPKAVPVRSRRDTNPIYSRYVYFFVVIIVFRSQRKEESDSEPETVIPQDITKKILRVAREQLVEEGLEEDDGDYSEQSDFDDAQDHQGYIGADEEYEDEDEDMQMQYANKRVTFSDEDDMQGKGRSRHGIDLNSIETDLPQEIVEHYTRIGKFLSVYTVGKIPKGFKVLPTRKQWEELLYFTNPIDWTPHAHYQATKIFASNLNDNLAQRYFNLVLLPAIRTDVRENKKLHFQLYQALKKALFKPLAFMKGVLLPLADAPDCTLREAVIVGSVLSKMTVPMAYGAASLFKLAVKADQWTPVKSVLITMLLNKKYALPSQVVVGLVSHFVSFAKMDAKMPVLWHSSLLTFVQRYRESLEESQKQQLRDLVSVQSHYQISPEILRELSNQMDM
jgi:essential nuclear protein 1